MGVISKTSCKFADVKEERRGNGLHTCVVQGRGENRGGILRFPQFMNCFLTQRKKPRKKEEKKEEKRVHTQQWAKEVMLLLVFPRKVAALLEWTSTPARMNFMLCAPQRGIAQDPRNNAGLQHSTMNQSRHCWVCTLPPFFFFLSLLLAQQNAPNTAQHEPSHHCCCISLLQDTQLTFSFLLSRSLPCAKLPRKFPHFLSPWCAVPSPQSSM